MWVHQNSVHPLKVNVMSPADRPIPQTANAHQGLNADRDGRYVSEQVRAVPREKAERMDAEQGSCKPCRLPVRADP